MENYFRIWANRENFRGYIFNWLYILRNTIFGIRPQTIRPIIESSYSSNLVALHQLLELTKRSKTKVLLYIPPIRSDVPIPYAQQEYSRFIKDIEMFRANYKNVNFRDYSSIIPGKYWGYKEATNFVDKKEFDFMHFQFEGHRILADSLLSFFSSRR